MTYLLVYIVLAYALAKAKPVAISCPSSNGYGLCCLAQGNDGSLHEQRRAGIFTSHTLGNGRS